MKTILTLIIATCFAALVYAQPMSGLPEEEAIRLAKEIAESSNPPMNSSQMQARAVYVSSENSWIVRFADPSSDAVASSDYVLRVQASSGKAPELLLGSQKERYRAYFEGQ